MDDWMFDLVILIFVGMEAALAKSRAFSSTRLKLRLNLTTVTKTKI